MSRFDIWHLFLSLSSAPIAAYAPAAYAAPAYSAYGAGYHAPLSAPIVKAAYPAYGYNGAYGSAYGSVYHH